MLKIFWGIFTFPTSSKPGKKHASVDSEGVCLYIGVILISSNLL